MERKIEATYKTYKNDTMRNDIRRAKVALMKTTYISWKLWITTPYTDPAWMRLFIDTMLQKIQRIGKKSSLW